MPDIHAPDKLKDITDKLETGIRDIFASDRYAEYLNTMAKFHNYSLNNTILIAMQKPDASLIAGYSSWKNKFSRQVRKGEKGITILAPAPYKVKVEMEKLDPVSHKPILNADGKPVTEQVEVTKAVFKPVNVFDVSQTDGKPLPVLGVSELKGTIEHYPYFFEALKSISPVPVDFEPISNGAKGYYSHNENRIAINEGMSEIQTVKTAIHEIAHAKLHSYDNTGEIAAVDKHTKEVEAESVAYTVCQKYGIETSDYSFGYIAGWSAEKELAVLKSSLETIRSAAADIISSIDQKLQSLDVSLSIEKEKPVPKKESIREQLSAAKANKQDKSTPKKEKIKQKKHEMEV